jgi:hypothetical protein
MNGDSAIGKLPAPDALAAEMETFRATPLRRAGLQNRPNAAGARLFGFIHRYPVSGTRNFPGFSSLTLGYVLEPTRAIPTFRLPPSFSRLPKKDAPVRYEGKIYRPWMEMDSILIQTTIGCTHNRCTFCDMYRDRKFRIRPPAEVLEDIETARDWFGRIDSMFLTDGNVLAIPTGDLHAILEKIETTIPECRSVSLYASFNDIRRKSAEELTRLRNAGLRTAYVGLESGDPETLARIDKRMTPEQAVEGMEKARAAGIEVLVSLILGLGGEERSEIHARRTADLLNRLRPDQIAVLSLAVQPGTPLAEDVQTGKFVQATPSQILEEERILLESLDDFETVYWGDHVSNITPKRGRLPAARKAFLEQIERDLAEHPVTRLAVLPVEPW